MPMNKKFIELLLKEWLKKVEYLDDKKRENLFNIGICSYQNSLEFLYKINQTIGIKGKRYENKESEITYERQGLKHIIIYKNNKMEFNDKEIKSIICTMIDILEKIYPLGTMVELKKKYIEKLLNKKEIEKAAVIIVNRYVFHSEANTFFQYAGVVYPIGLVGEGKTISFTSTLIDKVVKEGYSDEKDEAYIYLMKKELIVDKGMNSYGFTLEENRRIYGNIIGVEN